MGCCSSTRKEPEPTKAPGDAPAGDLSAAASKKEIPQKYDEEYLTLKRDSYGLLPTTTRLLEKEFAKYDKDGSGGIDEFELRQVMQDYGVQLSKSAHKALMKKYGIKSEIGTKQHKHSVKQIKKEQFIEMMAPYMRAAPSENLTEDQLKNLKVTFSRVDQDGSGSIDVKELKALLRSGGKQLTDDQVLKVLNKFDADKNGQLSFDEYVDMLCFS